MVYFFYRNSVRSGTSGRAAEYYDYRIMLEGAFLALAAVSLTIDLFTYKYAWLVFFMIAFLRNVAPVNKSAAQYRYGSEYMLK